MDKKLSLQTTANVNLVVKNSPIIISSSDFDIRYISKRKSDFLLILYEQQQQKDYFILNKTSDLIQTNHFASYYIQIHSIIFDSIDFIIIKADNNTIIRLYDFSKLNTREEKGNIYLNSKFIMTLFFLYTR